MTLRPIILLIALSVAPICTTVTQRHYNTYPSGVMHTQAMYYRLLDPTAGMYAGATAQWG
jgi:hypothetical protein